MMTVKSQAYFCDLSWTLFENDKKKEVSQLFHEMFKLCGSDLAEVDFPNEFAHNDNDDESLDVDAGHDVHDARVELKPNVGG